MRMRPGLALLTVIIVLFGILQPALSQDAATPLASPVAVEEAGIARPMDSTTGDVDLDVLFIGAHPDDEAFGLAAYGQWNEYADVEVGVITITRGEGGGNAVGTEEGPALGLIREREERTAVSYAGIEHIYNLDKVDFYYTVSAPLTEQTWDFTDTLARVVTVIRATRPEVIITMNPSPTPGNHGHHQMAARLAVAGYISAADETSFTESGFAPWTVSSLYRAGATGEAPMGETCVTEYIPADPTDVVFGVWQGTFSERNNRTWGEVARDGQRSYASQGWAVFPDAPTDPAEIQCNYFTLLSSRVAVSQHPESATALLENAVVPEQGGLPLGTRFSISVDSPVSAEGYDMPVQSSLELPDGTPGEAVIEYMVPDGWVVGGASGGPVASPAASGPGETTITIPAGTEPGRYIVGAMATMDGATGYTQQVVDVVASVSGELEPLPEIAQFQEWARLGGMSHLSNLISPVTSIAVGESRPIGVIVTNNTAETQTGEVTLELPAGFSAETGATFADLPPGESTTVTVMTSNSDPSLPTSNQGGTEGTYPITITTTFNDGSSTSDAGLNLVPATTVPQAGGGVSVDGHLADGEYTGDALDLSRVWEGEDPESAADASGTAHVAWTEDGLYVAVEVTDDTLGTVLTPEDAKRHWRTDSVEIAIDPLGTAPNTSATFKVGVFPTTTEGSPAAYRDADAYQGPVVDTAPGFEVASAVTEPYTGYVLETFIPFDSLPAEIDPAQATMNIFIYDSDTQDLTGQTRLGWSTWNGVQGDPYRWGSISLAGEAGATPVASPIVAGESGDAEVDAPIMPLDVALSTHSPLSIAQSAADGVPLAGMPPVEPGKGLVFTEGATIGDGGLEFAFASTVDGTAEAFVIDESGNVIASQTIGVTAGATDITIGDVQEAGGLTLLVSFLSNDGRVQAVSVPIST